MFRLLLGRDSLAGSRAKDKGCVVATAVLLLRAFGTRMLVRDVWASAWVGLGSCDVMM